MADFFGSIILIENNEQLLGSILSDKNLQEMYPCVHHRKLSTALSAIKNRKDARLFIVSSSTSGTRGFEEVKKIRELFPELPILYIEHKPNSFPKLDFESITLFTQIEKPTTFAEIIVKIKEIFKKDERWDDLKPSPEQKDIELDLKEKEYIPTRLADFIFTEKSYFNVFIKLSASKFVKILNVGDPIEKEFIQKYKAKNVAHLYLPAEEHKKYIALSEKLSFKIIHSPNAEISASFKMKKVMNLGAAISQSLNSTGITPEKLDYASGFMNQSIALIKSMRFKHDSVSTFLKTLEDNDHTTTVSFTAGMMANELGFESVKSIKLVGIAALVHDIGLYDLAPALLDDEEALSSKENQAIFDKHAKHGADILRASGNFEESLCLAVEQHHLRRRGTFGNESRTNNINIVTEIIGVSDDFYNYVIKGGANKDKMAVFLNTHLKNFSPAIEKAFMKMLTKKKNKSA